MRDIKFVAIASCVSKSGCVTLRRHQTKKIAPPYSHTTTPRLHVSVVHLCSQVAVRSVLERKQHSNKKKIPANAHVCVAFVLAIRF